MSVEFRIVPWHGVCIVTFIGEIGIAETMASIAECARHPDFRLGMNHLFDLSTVTGVEKDFPAYLSLQAKALENIGPAPSNGLLVYFAPTRIAQDMAEMIRKSWEGLDWVVVRVVTEEDQALDLLGIQAESVAALLAQQN